MRPARTLAKKGNIPVGYYKDEKKTAETFRTINGVRYAIPGDYAQVEEDGTVTMLGRGSVSIMAASLSENLSCHSSNMCRLSGNAATNLERPGEEPPGDRCTRRQAVRPARTLAKKGNIPVG